MATDLSGEATFAPGVQSITNRQTGNPTFGVTVGNSPFTWTAPYPVAAVVSGGSVSIVSYTRGLSVLPLGITQGIIELNTGDSLTITWLVTKPTLTIIPR